MTNDFYCEQVLTGFTPVNKIAETDTILAFHHTRPFYPVHIVVIPKHHIASLTALEPTDNLLILELFAIIKTIAAQVINEHGACRVLTNLGNLSGLKTFTLAYYFG